MNLVNSDGAQLGQVIGTSSLDGTTMTGTYQVMGQGQGAAPGCVNGDSGICHAGALSGTAIHRRNSRF